MRKTLKACLLVLVLSCPTVAGEIHTPRQEPPPNNGREQTTLGEIHNPKTSDETTAKIVLILLQSVLSAI